jgi:hypothetical protein
VASSRDEMAGISHKAPSWKSSPNSADWRQGRGGRVEISDLAESSVQVPEDSNDCQYT